MIAMTKSSKTFAALAALALPVTAGAQSQELEPQAGVQSGGDRAPSSVQTERGHRIEDMDERPWGSRDRS